LKTEILTKNSENELKTKELEEYIQKLNEVNKKYETFIVEHESIKQELENKDTETSTYEQQFNELKNAHDQIKLQHENHLEELTSEKSRKEQELSAERVHLEELKQTLIQEREQEKEQQAKHNQDEMERVQAQHQAALQDLQNELQSS